MNRLELIKKIFEKTSFQNYLEIGCQTGFSFLPVNANRKIAVDPVFEIPLKSKLKWYLKQPKNFKNKFFELESDTFFVQQKSFLENGSPIDVALVDGLHTFGAALKDTLNTLKYLNENGIIILHDCLPPHEAASYPSKFFPTPEEIKTIENWTGEWCGDVWKSIVYLRRKLGNQLDVFVLDNDYGLGIVIPKEKIDAKNLVIDQELYNEIDQLTYTDLRANLENLIGLKPKEYASKVVDIIVNKQ